MRLTPIKWLALVAVALLPCALAAASFTASLDRDSMTLGEQATLSLKFEDVQPKDAPGIPNIPGLQFQYVGPSSSFSFVNGQTSSSVTYNYIVTAQRDGEFTIPRLRANVGGQQLDSAPLKLQVYKATPPTAAAVNSGSEPAFMKFTFPKHKVYVGEPIVGRLELYLRDDVQNFGNFQLTGTPTDGFSAGKPAELQNQRRRAQVGNRVYTVVPLALPLTAVRTGPLTLGPFSASVVVVVPSQNQGGDPFLRFFNQGEQKQVTMATEPFSVEAQPLPSENKPANFIGAIGNFDMTATAGPTTVTVGDPITVRVQISGRGALDGVTLPVQDAWRDFKTYPPTTKLENSDQFGFQGTKTFEQIISPQNSDIHELPALSFSYFNPDDGRYHTLTQPAVKLTVKPAGATPLPSLAGNKNAPQENQAPQDILPIRVKLDTLSPVSRPWVASPAFLAAQSVPVLAFLAALIWRKRAEILANNPRLRRQRAVAALIATGLGDLKKCAAANKPDDFFATLFRLLQEQLGERLDCPASAITENVVEEHPVLQKAPPALREALREQFQLCNQARYAPVRGASELNSVAIQFEKLINQLREVKA
ncbi:MAG TPA: BatD family protein [Verrucomicrobiae bacterium]